MVKAEKMFVFILASLFLAVIFVFFPEVSDTATPMFLLILGTYVCLDVAVVLKKTQALPKGEYHEVKKYQYYVALAFNIALFALGLVMSKKFNAPLSGSLNILGASTLLILSTYMGVLQGNRLLTGTAPKETETTASVPTAQ